MTRGEAIKRFQLMKKILSIPNSDAARTIEAIDMEIEALKREPQKDYPTEWCEQCTLWEDNKCMAVARCKSNIEALKQVMNDDLISRTEAIEAIEIVDWYHQNSNKDMVHGANDDEHQAWYKAQDIYKALEDVPSADRPKKVIAQITFNEEKLREIVKEAVERFKEEYEITDRPRGEWIPVSEKLPSEKKAVLICDSGGNRFVGKLTLTDYGYKWGVPLCVVWVDIEDGDAWMPLPEPYKGGADMKGGDK